MHGKISFDYTQNNGIRLIGNAGAEFATSWTNASNTSIHVYQNPPSITGVALAQDLKEFSQIRDAARFDFTSNSQAPKVGEIVVIKRADSYCAIKIMRLKARSHGDTQNEVTIEYIVLPPGQRSFANISLPEMVDETFSKRVLLLGAGFSKNWGGFLAKEVGSFLMGQAAIQKRPELMRLLARDVSFEDALEKTRMGEFEEADEAAMQAGIINAFNEMDRVYQNPNGLVLNYTADDFITRFCPHNRGTGYIFSLNQDLLLERICGHYADKPRLSIPGIRWQSPTHIFPAAANQISLATPLNPNVDRSELLGNFNLIKLHGSINWREENNSTMVMGRRKAQAISNSPLLEWYHRIFERVLSAGNVKLMVIGYSWMDDHINDVITGAIQNHGLKIYSWDIRTLNEALANYSNREVILDNMCGAFLRPLAEVMPPNPQNPHTPARDRIIADFF